MPGKSLTAPLAVLAVCGLALSAQAQQQGGVRLGCPITIGPEGVAMIQEQLRGLGHDVDVDGEWDDQTAQAVRQFQEQAGLPATGEMDFRTLAELEVDFQQMASAVMVGEGAGAMPEEQQGMTGEQPAPAEQ